MLSSPHSSHLFLSHDDAIFTHHSLKLRIISDLSADRHAGSTVYFAVVLCDFSATFYKYVLSLFFLSHPLISIAPICFWLSFQPIGYSFLMVFTDLSFLVCSLQAISWFLPQFSVSAHSLYRTRVTYPDWKYYYTERLWCWEGLGAGGEGDDRGWDGWMASRTRWTWVWVNSGSWWWTERPGVLRFMGSQRVGHDWATELNWTELMTPKLLPIGLTSLGSSRQICLLIKYLHLEVPQTSRT